MAIPGHKFVRAHFSNNERTIVESFWTDGKVTRPEYIEAKEGDPNWENLLTHIDIDALHEATYKHIRNQNQAFEASIIEIAKARGLKTTIEDINNVDLLTWFVPLLFKKDETTEVESKELLFNFKLKIFEMDFIKACKKRSNTVIENRCIC